MSTRVAKLYCALRKAGVDEQMAKHAARAALGADPRTDLATKAALADLKIAVITWNVGAIAVMTAIFAAIVHLA
jgi:hypothetical protein